MNVNLLVFRVVIPAPFLQVLRDERQTFIDNQGLASRLASINDQFSYRHYNLIIEDIQRLLRCSDNEKYAYNAFDLKLMIIKCDNLLHSITAKEQEQGLLMYKQINESRVKFSMIFEGLLQSCR